MFYLNHIQGDSKNSLLGYMWYVIQNNVFGLCHKEKIKW